MNSSYWPRSKKDRYNHTVDGLFSHRLLSQEEERDLAKRTRSGDAVARSGLIESNTRLAARFAWKMAVRKDPSMFDDLFGYALCGLVRAASKFDPDKQVRFSTYATWWIKQAIQNGYEMLVRRPAHIPSYCLQCVAKMRKTIRPLSASLRRIPTLGELAAHVGTTAGKAENSLAAARLLAAGLAPLGDEDLMEAKVEAPIPLSRCERDELVLALQHLEPRTRRIIEMRYGLGEHDTMTLAEIGAAVGLSRERVRQIERKALAALRELLGERDERHATCARPTSSESPALATAAKPLSRADLDLIGAVDLLDAFPEPEPVVRTPAPAPPPSTLNRAWDALRSAGVCDRPTDPKDIDRLRSRAYTRGLGISLLPDGTVVMRELHPHRR